MDEIEKLYKSVGVEKFCNSDSEFMDWLIKNWIKEDCDKYIERLLESEVENAR